MAVTGNEAFELHEATIDSLQEGMRSGQLTARRITELYLARIEALNQRGPELRAIIETNPDALAIADQLDAERKAGKVRGPLHGIPIALKDNLDTHDRMTTTAGSLALEGSIPPQDSFVAQKLREAGAILLAKANMSEWAYWRGMKATSGWSARGGQCRNPYALDRNPCGSSSGSGTAVSANLVALTIGTETGGSIMCPSSINGVVGIKPTVGLWSRSGIIPISHSQDSAGPMARTVRDAAIALGAACGVDPRDTATGASAGRFHADYTTFLDPAGLKGARLGIARSFPGFHDRVLRALRRGGRRAESGRRRDHRPGQPAAERRRVPGAAHHRPQLRVQGEHQQVLPVAGAVGPGEEPDRAHRLQRGAIAIGRCRSSARNAW